MIAQAKLKDMELDPSKDMQMKPDGWAVHAARLIPVVEEFGIEVAKRFVASSKAESNPRT